MKRRVTQKDWLPLARVAKNPLEVPTGEAFRPAWIDFERGIRVGNLEPHERITRILKYRLEQEYDTGFVTDRWGRGVYWQNNTFYVSPLIGNADLGVCGPLNASCQLRTMRVGTRPCRTSSPLVCICSV